MILLEWIAGLPGERSLGFSRERVILGVKTLNKRSQVPIWDSRS
jgi:hypothetical protein